SARPGRTPDPTHAPPATPDRGALLAPADRRSHRRTSWTQTRSERSSPLSPTAGLPPRWTRSRSRSCSPPPGPPRPGQGRRRRSGCPGRRGRELAEPCAPVPPPARIDPLALARLRSPVVSLDSSPSPESARRAAPSSCLGIQHVRSEAALPRLDRHGQARDGGGVQDVRGGAVESLPYRVRLCRLLLGSILLLSRGFARLWCLWIHRPLLNLPAVRHRPHALGSST